MARGAVRPRGRAALPWEGLPTAAVDLLNIVCVSAATEGAGRAVPRLRNLVRLDDAALSLAADTVLRALPAYARCAVLVRKWAMNFAYGGGTVGMDDVQAFVIGRVLRARPGLTVFVAATSSGAPAFSDDLFVLALSRARGSTVVASYDRYDKDESRAVHGRPVGFWVQVRGAALVGGSVRYGEPVWVEVGGQGVLAEPQPAWVEDVPYSKGL